MTADLPSSGPDREIFVRALRDFSDRCDLPDLNPACPFYEDGPERPVCAEQCMDLLSDHPAAPTGIEIIPGMRAMQIQRRPRRRLLDAKPFDSREQFIDDSTKPIGERRPSALLHALRLGFVDPGTTGAADLELIVDELRRRGIQADRIVRTIIAHDAARFLATVAMFPILLGSADPTQGDPHVLEFERHEDRLRTWRPLLLGKDLSAPEWHEEATRKGTDWSAEVVMGAFNAVPKVATWFGQIAITDFASWAVPDELQWSVLDTATAMEIDPIDRWMTDRFLNTYPRSWLTDSLKSEWKYLHGEGPLGCDAAAMKTRIISMAELAQTIADRTVNDRSPSAVSAPPDAALVEAAASRLRSGNYSAAAAIFEAGRITNPSEPESHNNYGFCMMAEDSAKALVALERAADLGWQHQPINVANRVLALLRLDRLSSAIDLADEFARSKEFATLYRGYLWDPKIDPPGGRLLVSSEARIYICDLASEVSRRIGDEAAARLWEGRAMHLRIECAE